MNSACVAEKAARAGSLLKLTSLPENKVARNKRIGELTQRLEEALLAQEKSVSGKRHTEDAVAEKESLTEQVKQLTARVTRLDGKVLKGKDVVADFNVKLKEAGKRVEDIMYEKGNVQARLL